VFAAVSVLCRASGVAVASAVGVRGYPGLGGRIGIAGTFEDRARLERASLTAGAFLLAVGVGCWGSCGPGAAPAAPVDHRAGAGRVGPRDGPPRS
jgi:hypothetical protein